MRSTAAGEVVLSGVLELHVLGEALGLVKANIVGSVAEPLRKNIVTVRSLGELVARDIETIEENINTEKSAAISATFSTAYPPRFSKMILCSLMNYKDAQPDNSDRSFAMGMLSEFKNTAEISRDKADHM